MIKRIYVDNFKSFVNFAWSPAKLALLMGANGSGKTSLAELLWSVRALIVDGDPVSRHFPSTTRTRWDKRLESRIELDVSIADAGDPGALFRYELVIEHHPERPTASRIKRETLDRNGRRLMAFIDGSFEVFGADGNSMARLPLSEHKSSLALNPGGDRDDLGAFKRWIALRLMFVRPDPRAMSSRTDGFEVLETNLSNFATWYPHVIAKDLNAALTATQSLREILPGFDSLRVSSSTRRLEAVFAPEGGERHAIDFEDLSDGQRQLCALYVFWSTAAGLGGTIIFDEPDNYVALREIQPWLHEVLDLALTADGPQVWFVSHHPEILDHLAPDYGIRFVRHASGPTRLEPFKGLEGLTAGETVARGWDHE